MSQANLTNPLTKNHCFLAEMYGDSYFPNFLVDKGTAILVNLCTTIESKTPENLEELYKISGEATELFNELCEEFYENDSEIETAARECIAADFDFISKTYGFDADIEELIGNRDW